MLLKDYKTRELIYKGIMGLCIRINNDTKDLNTKLSIPECINEIKNHPNVNKILNSNIVGERDFFDTKVLVIDYKED